MARLQRKMNPVKRVLWMKARIKHDAYKGGKESPEHYVWRSMLARCNNTADKHYKYYGGRGVSVCDRWLEFSTFLEDMGKRPSANHSLDRINNDLGYSKNNCRWATRSEQQKNKQTTKWYSNGVFTGTITECAAYLGLSHQAARYRFKHWGSFEKGKLWLLLPKVLERND